MTEPFDPLCDPCIVVPDGEDALLCYRIPVRKAATFNIVDYPVRELPPVFIYELRTYEVRDAEVMRLSWNDGRLLFDGVDIETELFMAYVGLFDAVYGEDGLTPKPLIFGPPEDL